MDYICVKLGQAMVHVSVVGGFRIMAVTSWRLDHVVMVSCYPFLGSNDSSLS